MVSQTQKLNASTGFASFLKSKWRSRDERPSRPQTINAMTDVERDYVRHSALKLALDG